MASLLLFALASLCLCLMFLQGIEGKIFSKEDDSDILEQWATYNTKEGEYYGAKASINAYGLNDVKVGQQSSSQIWVLNFDDSRYNSIEVGWHVHPELYGDNQTRLFTSWTVDNDGKTGCFNLLCPGFVQKHPKIMPGAILQPLSTYNGKQYHITLLVSKDPNTGDWLLNYGDGENSALIGYWPKSLFSILADSASLIGWGGIVNFPPDVTSTPPMGSGHYDSEGYGKAAYIMHIKIVDKDNNLVDPGDLVEHSNKGKCYSLGGVKYIGDSDRYAFFFGGPGGCEN